MMEIQADQESVDSIVGDASPMVIQLDKNQPNLESTRVDEKVVQFLEKNLNKTGLIVNKTNRFIIVNKKYLQKTNVQENSVLVLNNEILEQTPKVVTTVPALSLIKQIKRTEEKKTSVPPHLSTSPLVKKTSSLFPIQTTNSESSTIKVKKNPIKFLPALQNKKLKVISMQNPVSETMNKPLILKTSSMTTIQKKENLLVTNSESSTQSLKKNLIKILPASALQNENLKVITVPNPVPEIVNKPLISETSTMVANVQNEVNAKGIHKLFSNMSNNDPSRVVESERGVATKDTILSNNFENTQKKRKHDLGTTQDTSKEITELIALSDEDAEIEMLTDDTTAYDEDAEIEMITNDTTAYDEDAEIEMITNDTTAYDEDAEIEMITNDEVASVEVITEKTTDYDIGFFTCTEIVAENDTEKGNKNENNKGGSNLDNSMNDKVEEILNIERVPNPAKCSTEPRCKKIRSSRNPVVSVECDGIQQAKSNNIEINLEIEPRDKLLTNKTNSVNISTNTTKPINTSTSMTKPVNISTNTTKPVNISTNTTKPVNISTNTTKPVNISTSTTKSVNTSHADRTTPNVSTHVGFEINKRERMLQMCMDKNIALTKHNRFLKDFNKKLRRQLVGVQQKCDRRDERLIKLKELLVLLVQKYGKGRLTLDHLLTTEDELRLLTEQNIASDSE